MQLKVTSKMKRNATAIIFCTLCALYLMNVSITMASLKITPNLRKLQPPPPNENKISSRKRDGLLELPIYTSEMAAQAIRPAPWTCGARDDTPIDPVTNQRPMFAFVHIYKTAGSTMRSFFQTYAHICRKGWMCLQRCSDVKSSSIQTANNWKNCQVEHALDRNRKMEQIGVKRQLYKHVNNTVLRDHFDLFGGHTKIGAGDYVLEKNGDVHPVRHIVFLRDPMDRYVSGVLYQNQKKKTGWSSVDFAGLVKKRILESRNAGEYWDRSLSYLLDPSQAEHFESIKPNFRSTNTTEQFAEYKAKVAIHNLAKYNVIIGMTEYMDQSMEILKYVLMTKANKEQQALLDKHATTKSLNVSKKGGVTTSTVRSELEKDEQFMSAFKEYVKYEKMINDYALQMHVLQYKQVVRFQN